jgi:hypothetical protein
MVLRQAIAYGAVCEGQGMGWVLRLLSIRLEPRDRGWGGAAGTFDTWPTHSAVSD